MKTELSMEGFNEIPMAGQQEINGGIFPILVAIIAGVVIAASAELIDDWDNFKNGLAGRPEEK